MGRIVNKGEEVYVAILESPHTGESYHAIGLDGDSVALECFSKALGSIDKELWHEHTEAIYVYKIFPYVFAFNMDDIQVLENNSIVMPAGADCMKLGVALVSFLSPQEPGQPLGFKYNFMKVDQRRVYDHHAN
tara:strand:- start:975 stop:1373 length:399 start_codon:yes stop_codon:yes gene_type:complete